MRRCKLNIDKYFERKSKKYFLVKRIKIYRDILINSGMKNSCYELDKFERKWKYLKRKYSRINIFGIEFVSIGETIPRLFAYLRDSKKRDSNIYSIVLPTFFPDYVGGIYNKSIFEIFGKYIHFVTEENILFWLYVVMFHADRINIECFDAYKFRAAEVINIKEGKKLIPFDNKFTVYAKEKMKRMGIKGEYICLHARESSTKAINFNGYPDTSVCDANINSFGLACSYMNKLGYQAVRMGKDEDRLCEIEGVIDYSNNFYDELMDFYLIANCKFLIGSAAGLTIVTPFWGRPVLSTNVVTFSYGWESQPTTEYDIYIPKKFYSKKKKRFLNLYEIFNNSNKLDRYNERFDYAGIEVIDNSEEEILKAAIEINDKIDHTWKKTEDEAICMKKYWEIVNLWKSRHLISVPRKHAGATGYEMIAPPISYNYLKDNMYLLNVKELK